MGWCREWLSAGLQNRERGFNSRPSLHALVAQRIERRFSTPGRPGFESSRECQHDRVPAPPPKQGTVTGHGSSTLPAITMEGWLRGLKQQFAKLPTARAVPGFESPSFRQFAGIVLMQHARLPSVAV